VTIESILDFWFGGDPDDGVVAKEKAVLWWSKNTPIDEEIRTHFEPWVLKAGAGELADWQTTPSGRLALILLTDQFPRNIYRDSPQAFAFDDKALVWSLGGIKLDFDLKLRPIERVFFYLPLEHAESLRRQEQSVKLFRELADGVGADLKTTFEGYLDYAVRHRDIIARFGRFPHRNQILGRESTPEELAFLNQPGSSF
jgi:uncharacterized protein (DUF924 family)